MSNLIRWNNLDKEISSMWQLMDRMFEDLSQNLDTRFPTSAPALDVVDHEDRFEVHVDLPGFAPEDVNIEFQNGVLVISAETNHESTEKKYTRRERYHGAYRRVLQLADVVDTENAQANFENGVLTLSLPKKPEAQPRRIPINTSAKVLNSGK